MIIEIVLEGTPRKMRWNKRSTVGVLMNMFVPADELERWTLTDDYDARFWPHEKLGDVVSDGQRIFITRKAGDAA